MMELLQLMWLPTLTCFILTGMHGYLGLQVIKRNVIFLDLALAQLMGLAAIVSIVLHATGGYEWAIKGVFVLGGAGLLTASRSRHHGISPELFIGLLYVGAMAASMAFMSRFGTESHHLHDLLVGNLLFVEPVVVIKTGILYASLGAFWWLLNRLKSAKSIHWGWDFLFYVVFAIVVNSSVALGGVLLVFALLIAPAAMAMLTAHTSLARLLMAWAIGVVGSLGGILLSLWTDTPPAAAVVLVLFLLFFLVYFIKRRTVADPSVNLIG